jgi:hypothetical protein
MGFVYIGQYTKRVLHLHPDIKPDNHLSPTTSCSAFASKLPYSSLYKLCYCHQIKHALLLSFWSLSRGGIGTWRAEGDAH